jgi:hypothetical protein
MVEPRWIVFPPRWATQKDLNRYLDQCVSRAERAEIRRDREPFESPSYWRFHDTAMRWYKRIDDLSPNGEYWKRLEAKYAAYIQAEAAAFERERVALWA